MLENWPHRAVFITGCDSGFGHQLAHHLDGAGVPVFAGCLTEKGKKSLMESASSRLQALHLDVTSTQSILDSYEFIKKNMPVGTKLWGVVNNAGVMKGCGPLELINRKALEDCFQVNAIGMAEVCRVFLPLLRESGGRYVNVTSSAGLLSLPNFIPYSASKSAAEAINDSIRREVYMFGVSSHAIEPSGYNTNIMSSIEADIEKSWKGLSPDIKKFYGQDYPNIVKLAIADGNKHILPTDLSPVIEAEVHALFGCYPLTHYQVGKGSKIIFLLGYYLPPWIVDPVSCRVTKGYFSREQKDYLKNKSRK